MNNSPIIIGGCGRSGTTLFRLMLDSHPRIHCGPELKLLVQLAEHARYSVLQWSNYLSRNSVLGEAELWPVLGAGASDFLEFFREHSGKERIAEKTPVNVLVFDSLYKMLPDAQFIQVIRDGRDVAASLLGMKWVMAATGEQPDYTKKADAAAHFWVQCVTSGQKLLDDPSRYHEIFYEELVTEPEAVLRHLCVFLGEEFSPKMLNQEKEKHQYGEDEQQFHGVAVKRPPNPSAIGRFRKDLSAKQIEEFEAIAGPLLQELGYELAGSGESDADHG